MKKTVIFFKPYNGTLESLKTNLNGDNDCTIYEVSNPQEYGQILGILKESYTFSSDLDVTQKYVSQNKKIIIKGQHKNVFVSNQMIPPRVQNALVDNGIDEILKENLPQKLYVKNIEVFFKKFDQNQKKVTELEANINKSDIQNDKNQKISEHQNNKFNPLSGKGKTENLENGYLQGKSNTERLESENKTNKDKEDQTQNKESNKLLGDLEEKDTQKDNFTGKAKTEHKDSPPLSGSTKESEGSIDPLTGKLNTDHSENLEDGSNEDISDEIGSDGIQSFNKDKKIDNSLNENHHESTKNKLIDFIIEKQTHGKDIQDLEAIDSPSKLKEIYSTDDEIEIALLEEEKLDELNNQDKETILKYKVDKKIQNKSDEIPEGSIGIDIETFNEDTSNKKITIEESSANLIQEAHTKTLCLREENPVFSFNSLYLEYLILYQDIYHRNQDNPEELFHFISFFIQQEFKYNLVIIRPDENTKFKVLYNGYTFQQIYEADVISWLEKTKSQMELSKTYQVREINFLKNKTEYYYPYLEEESEEVIAGALIHSQDNISDYQIKAINLFLQVSKGALIKLMNL